MGALSVPAYKILLTSQIAAMFGMQMDMVARGVLAWNLTGSYAITGLLSFSFGVPMLLFSLVGGAVADRVDKKKLTITATSVNAVVAFTLCVLVATDVITIPLMFMLGLIEGTMFAFMMPARQSLMRELVPDAQFANAIALSSAGVSATTVLGPAIAGGLIAVFGVALVYGLVACTGAFAALSYLRLPASKAHVLPAGTRRDGLFVDVRMGVGYVVRTHSLRVLMLMAFVPALLAMPYNMLLPGFSDVKLGNEDFYSILVTCAGIGSVLGSMTVAAFSDMRRKVLLQMFFGGGIATGLLVLGLGSMAFGLAAAIAGVFILGSSLLSYQTINNTLMMTEADPRMLGRVMSIVMLTFSAVPMAGYPLGILADTIGADVLFATMGTAVATALIVITILNPKHVFSESRLPGHPRATEGEGYPSAEAAPGDVGVAVGERPSAASS